MFLLHAVTLEPRWHLAHRRGLVTVFLSEWVRCLSKSSSSAVSCPDPSPDGEDIYASLVECSKIWRGSVCPTCCLAHVWWRLSHYAEALLTTFLLDYRIDLPVLPRDWLIRRYPEGPSPFQSEISPIILYWVEAESNGSFSFWKRDSISLSFGLALSMKRKNSDRLPQWPLNQRRWYDCLQHKIRMIMQQVRASLCLWGLLEYCIQVPCTGAVPLREEMRNTNRIYFTSCCVLTQLNYCNKLPGII